MVNLNVALLNVDYLKQSLSEVLQCWCDGGGDLQGVFLNPSLLCNRSLFAGDVIALFVQSVE